MPGEWLELSNLVGPASYIKERVGAYKEAGVTVLSVNPVGPDAVQQIETLQGDRRRRLNSGTVRCMTQRTSAASSHRAGSRSRRRSRRTSSSVKRSAHRPRVYHRGAKVVDIWGGSFDRAGDRPYDDSTLQLVFSTTKGIVAIAVAMCVQRGLIDYDEKVATYWPEFAAHGKGDATVAQLLSHQCGLIAPDAPVTLADALDWKTDHGDARRHRSPTGRSARATATTR